jgi:hypothetical protein
MRWPFRQPSCRASCTPILAAAGKRWTALDFRIISAGLRRCVAADEAGARQVDEAALERTSGTVSQRRPGLLAPIRRGRELVRAASDKRSLIAYDH